MVLRTTTRNRRRARAIVRWARALVPAAVLVITPPPSTIEGSDDVVSDDVASDDVISDDAITVDADEVASGPLSLADAIARAVARGPARGGG